MKQNKVRCRTYRSGDDLRVIFETGTGFKHFEGQPVTENTFIYHEPESLEEFQALVPSEEQQLYILNAGIRYIVNGRVGGYMRETKKSISELEHNNEVVDTKEFLNTPIAPRTDAQIAAILRQQFIKQGLGHLLSH